MFFFMFVGSRKKYSGCVPGPNQAPLCAAKVQFSLPGTHCCASHHFPILTDKTFSCTWFCLPLLFIRVNWLVKLCWGTRVSWTFSAPAFAGHVFVCLCLELYLLLCKMRLVLYTSKLIKLCTTSLMLQAHALSLPPYFCSLFSLFLSLLLLTSHSFANFSFLSFFLSPPLPSLPSLSLYMSSLHATL